MYQHLTKLLVAKLLITSVDECWLWQGYKNPKGYGAIQVKGRHLYAHRLAMMIYHKRELVPGEIVMHICNTPLCCNPKHLKLGNLYENNQHRLISGNYHRKRKKVRKLLTPNQVVEIKLCLRMGQGVSKLAERFSCSKQAILDIRKGKTWRNVKELSHISVSTSSTSVI